MVFELELEVKLKKRKVLYDLFLSFVVFVGIYSCLFFNCLEVVFEIIYDGELLNDVLSNFLFFLEDWFNIFLEMLKFYKKGGSDVGVVW